MMITILGGTFAFLHPGHKELLKAAAATKNKVVIGLTTDSYLEANKKYGKVSFEKRKENLARYMGTLGVDFDIVPLESREGSSETGEDYECMVVSRETRSRALRINETRVSNGLRPMRIIVVPYVLAEDLFPISSTRIIQGEIDEEGKRIRPVRISVTTGNYLKLNAVQRIFSSLMSSISIDQRLDNRSEHEQPMGEETVELANKRAMSGLEDYDYSVGIEAGLFRDSFSDTYYDFHCAVVLDRHGEKTTGFSSGFLIPDEIVHEVKRGLDLSAAYAKLHCKEHIGSREGIVGALSGNRVIRSDLIEEAVRNALIPRLSVTDP